MTSWQLFAAVGMPLLLFLLAWAGARLIIRDINRRDRLHPGE
jgi:hypothetical protein